MDVSNTSVQKQGTHKTVDAQEILAVSDEFLTVFQVLLPLAVTPVPSCATAEVELRRSADLASVSGVRKSP